MPDVLLLVTSRAALTLSSEHLYEVPPLREREAVALFVERAAQAGAEVAPDAAVAAICRRLDRLPLAIELAAARVRVLEPQALLERLDRLLPLLKGGAPDLPARQQTLYATIAWSHDLLDDEERAGFRRLSVFAGSFTLESAEIVAETDLWTVESLVGKSLVRLWGSGRLGLLETIREFAAEQLESFGEGDATRKTHARHYLELALTLEPHLLSELFEPRPSPVSLPSWTTFALRSCTSSWPAGARICCAWRPRCGGSGWPMGTSALAGGGSSAPSGPRPAYRTRCVPPPSKGSR